MPCFHPVLLKDRGRVGCGQCWGCRREYARQWAVRCMHEASMHEDNCLLTLTYDDEHLPADSSLDRRAFPLFMKRVRKEVGHVRYFHCGEYGELSRRPHYHALLFGFDFPDKVLFTSRSGYPVWTSSMLSRLWPFGLSEIGTVTFASASYVARYVMKKITGKAAARHYQIVDGSTGEVLGQRASEYTTMSRRPGIGASWLDKYKCEVYPADSVVVRGFLQKPPRYYDLRFEAGSPEVMERLREKRRRSRKYEEETRSRLKAREECAKAQAGVYLRARGL